MKYFFVHKHGGLGVKTVFNPKYRDQLNFLITKEQVQEAINNNLIGNYNKIKAFKKGDTVTLASEFSGEDEPMKKYHDKDVEIADFCFETGIIKLRGDHNIEFYINDIKTL